MNALIEFLTDSQQTSAAIKNLGCYIIYFYPGIISIYLYNFFTANTTKHTQIFLIKSFSISYIYVMLLQCFFSHVLCKELNEASIACNLMLFSLSCVIPYILYRIRKSDMLSRICKLLKVETSTTSIPFELLGEKKEAVSCLKVYTKSNNYVYIGFLCTYQFENEYEKYIILTGYKKFYFDQIYEKTIEEHNPEDSNEKVYIRYDEIVLIEKISEERAKKDIYKTDWHVS